MTHEPTDRNAIDVALATLRESIDVPPVDPARERALVAAFDAHWTHRRGGFRRWVLAPAAVLMAVTVALNWLAMTHSVRVDSSVDAVSAGAADFVPWPGADAFPPFESGSMIRVDIPVSALPSLGLVTPAWAASVVEADVVVGQDGFARAIRLVQQP